MTSSKIDIWIKTGYRILATGGIEKIKVERVARMLKLNKSGFYYYFGEMNSYLTNLLDYHVDQANSIAIEISKCENIDPDFLLLIVKHKTFFQVEAELVAKYKSLHQLKKFGTAADIINQQLLTLWGKNAGLPENTDVALAYLNIIRHFFYSRIYSKKIEYEFLHTLITETKEILGKVSLERHAH